MNTARESLFRHGSLTDAEHAAWSRFVRSGIQSAFQFPAPDRCKSHEDWIRHGDECWRKLRSKVYRSLPTAWNSPMLAARDV